MLYERKRKGKGKYWARDGGWVYRRAVLVRDVDVDDNELDAGPDR